MLISGTEISNCKSMIALCLKEGAFLGNSSYWSDGYEIIGLELSYYIKIRRAWIYTTFQIKYGDY